MKKFIAFIVALICVFAVPFSACKFLEIDFGDGFFNQADGDNENGDGSELEQPNGGEEDGEKTEPENPNGDNDNKGGNTEPEQPNGGEEDGEKTEPENPSGGEEDGGNTEPENPNGGDNDKKEEEKPHECTYDYSAWSSDNTHHWHASTCHEHPENKIDYDSHNFINNKCIVCNKIKLDDSVDYVKLPNFTVETYNSAYKKGTFSSTDALGKVLIINFWYTTCGVCVEEMPDLEELNETYKDDIVVIAIHKNNNEQLVAQNFIDDYRTTTNPNKPKTPWTNYKTIFGKDYDDSGVDAIAKMCGIAGSDYPVTVVVDRQGYIIYTQMGNFMDFDYGTFQYTNMLAPYIEAALAR